MREFFTVGDADPISMIAVPDLKVVVWPNDLLCERNTHRNAQTSKAVFLSIMIASVNYSKSISQI